MLTKKQYQPNVPQGESAFRGDIEGLRALAILPILLLHAGFNWVRGGFVGVDIFFVISGFLITSHILRDINNQSFSLVAFYHKRAMRILPAMIVTVGTTLLAGGFLLFPVELIDLGRSAAATAAFGANIYFQLTADYFSGSSETKPLIHMWSLGVEEQFYVIMPLIMILLLIKLKRTQIDAHNTLISLAASSFIFGAWTSWNYPQAAYYLIFTRAWELLLGSIVATGRLPTVSSQGVRNTLGLSSLLVLIISAWQTRTSFLFPVPGALPPVLATGILLGYGPGTIASRILDTKALRFVGRLSYSLYLVHRPIAAFFELENGSTLSGSTPYILLGLTFALALLLHILVERPFLKASKRVAPSSSLTVGALALLGIASAGLWLAWRPTPLRNMPPEALHSAAWLDYADTKIGKAQFSTDQCFMLPTGPAIRPSCLEADPHRKNILLLGDSHAAQLSQALQESLPGWHVIQATAAGCRPLRTGRGLRRCHKLVVETLNRKDWAGVDAVVLAGRWLPNELRALSETVRELVSHNLKVIVVGPMVEYDIDLPRLIARQQAGLPSGYAASFLRRDRLALDHAVREAVDKAGGQYASARAFECPNATCRLSDTTGTPIHFDNSHLTGPAALEFVNAAIIPMLRRR